MINRQEFSGVLAGLTQPRLKRSDNVGKATFNTRLKDRAERRWIST